MTTGHPTAAKRGRDLPPSYLADRLRVSLLQAPGRVDSGSLLLERIDGVRDTEGLRNLLVRSLEPLPDATQLRAETEKSPLDDAFLDDWERQAEALLAANVADDRFDPGRPLQIVAKWRIVGLAHALAALPLVRAKLARRDEPIRLAAPLLTRPHLPSKGTNGPEAVEVVDFARSAEPDDASALRLRFLHGSSGDAALLAEAVGMLSPAVFWDAVARLRGASDTLPELIARLDGLGLLADELTSRAHSTEAKAGVAADLAMAACCGVPAWRPLIAVGQEVRYGPMQVVAPKKASLAVASAFRIADIDEAVVRQGYTRAPFSTAANADPERPLLAAWYRDGGTAACWSDPQTRRLLLAAEGDDKLTTALASSGMAASL